MATVDGALSAAEQRAWDVFSQAVDPASEDVGIPSGAAIVAADSPDLDTWKDRYAGEGRAVVVVDSNYGLVQRKNHSERGWLLLVGAAIFFAAVKGLGKVRIPA